MYPRLNKLSSILNGNNLGDFIQPMGSWVTSSFMSLLIKLIRSSGLAPIEIEDIKCNMDRSSMGDFLTYLNETHPEINFRSISLTKISNSVKNSLLRAGSDDIKIINKLYER